MSKPFSAAFLYLPMMVWLSSNVQAADQATLDKLVGYAKDACLVGTHVELHADVSGNITIRNPFKPGAEGAIDVKRTDVSGAPAYIDEQVRLVADRQIQECIRPYMIRIFEAILGTTVQSTPGAPSEQLIRAPQTAKMAETRKLLFGITIGLYSCSKSTPIC